MIAELRRRALESRAPADALAYLAGLSPSTIRLGLERVHAALARLGHPQRRVPALHVAGTNGKGSTCAFAAACLGQRYRTGLYTSPHLERVNERIKVGGEDVGDAALGLRILEVLEALPEEHGLTYFEFGTAVALHHFALERVEVAVLETGLGGRLDATSAAVPRVTAITPIAFDHQDFLGHTLTAIAAEKAGIVKPSVPLVSARQEPEALAVLTAAAERHGAALSVEGRDFEVRAVGDQVHYRSQALDLELPAPALRGPHQLQNLAVALASLGALGEAGFPLEAAELRAGVAQARWPGRLEELGGVVLDGAHNPHGARALVAALASVYPGRPVHLVFGVFADKDYRPMLEVLLPAAATAALVPIASPRSLAPAQYLAAAQALNPRSRAFDDVAVALEAQRGAAGASGVVVCAGSLFLVGQVRSLLRRASL